MSSYLVDLIYQNVIRLDKYSTLFHCFSEMSRRISLFVFTKDIILSFHGINWDFSYDNKHIIMPCFFLLFFGFFNRSRKDDTIHCHFDSDTQRTSISSILLRQRTITCNIYMQTTITKEMWNNFIIIVK